MLSNLPGGSATLPLLVYGVFAILLDLVLLYLHRAQGASGSMPQHLASLCVMRHPLALVLLLPLLMSAEESSGSDHDDPMLGDALSVLARYPDRSIAGALMCCRISMSITC